MNKTKRCSECSINHREYWMIKDKCRPCHFNQIAINLLSTPPLYIEREAVGYLSQVCACCGGKVAIDDEKETLASLIKHSEDCPYLLAQQWEEWNFS